MSCIDVHCHLDDPSLGDISALLGRIEEAGVKKIIAAGYDVRSSCLFADMSARFNCVYFTAGVHPTECKKQQGDLKAVEGLLKEKKCVAVGEIGLDYHYPQTDKNLQHEYFISQLFMAAEAGLPVQIHSRDCAEDTLNALKSNAKLLNCGFLMHCYSYSAETAKELLNLGAYFSFGGASTWKGSKKAAKNIVAIPKDRLLTETDSPYMPPLSVYGTFPNTPENIPEILANMANLKGLKREEMEECVYENAHRLFLKLKN